MPIYEYLCQSCAYRFEVKQGMKDDPIMSCERCGKDVTKLISAPAIMFKGSGWYITDYSDKMKPPTEANASETATKDDKAASKEDKAASSATPAASPTPAPAPTGTSNQPAGTSSSPAKPASSESSSSTPSTTGSTT